VSITQRLDRFQRRHPAIGFPLAVIYKFFDDQGTYLAALIAYYGFVSLFPLLLLMVTILGYALSDNPQLQQDLVDSALAQFPVIGDQIGENVASLRGNSTALVVGILGSLYGALGVANAAQNAMNRVWGVARVRRPNPFAARGRSVLILLLLLCGVLASALTTWVFTAVDVGGSASDAVEYWAALGVGVTVNAGMFVVGFRVLTARDLSVRDVWVGAVLASAAWHGLLIGGTYYVGRVVNGSTATYGVFSTVLGLIAWIFIVAVMVVLSAEVNVVRVERLWPRSLLTPFTDAVQLTGGDRRAYASYPQLERHKGFQKVDVRFDQRQPDEHPDERPPDEHPDERPPDGRPPDGQPPEARSSDGPPPDSRGR
jgi:membrane protein